MSTNQRKSMRAAFILILPLIAHLPAHGGQVINLPCTIGYKNPDSLISLVDGTTIKSWGRAGGILEKKYSKLIRFEKKMSYKDSTMGYPQDYGYCKVIMNR